jgi:hypothetical protein
MPQWRESPTGERQYLADDGYWYADGSAIQVAPTKFQSETSEAKSTIQGGAILAICSGALVSIGSFLPWLSASDSFESISRNALQLGANDSFSLDGAVVMAMGFIIVAVGITRLIYRGAPRFFRGSAIVAGLVALGESIWLAHSVQQIVDHAHNVSNAVVASIGYGTWIAIVGSALGILSGLILRSAQTMATRS